MSEATADQFGMFKTTNCIAQGVLKELRARNIEIHPFEKLDINLDAIKAAKGMHQITAFMPWNSLLSATEGALVSLLNSTIVDLGIKLSRPTPIQFFELELPKGVLATNYVEVEGVWLRGVTAYHIVSDSLIARFDVLVRWDDEI